MQRQALFIFLALTVLLAACARSTPTNFYLLESRLTPVSTDSLPAKSLRVAAVSVPEYLEREGIVSRVGESTQHRGPVSQLGRTPEPRHTPRHTRSADQTHAGSRNQCFAHW